MAKRANIYRIEKIERVMPSKYGYDLSMIVIVSEEMTDDEIKEKAAKSPSRLYIRFSDFADECV